MNEWLLVFVLMTSPNMPSMMDQTIHIKSEPFKTEAACIKESKRLNAQGNPFPYVGILACPTLDQWQEIQELTCERFPPQTVVGSEKCRVLILQKKVSI